MIGLFLVGCFVTAIVGLACALVIGGIREDSRAREELADDGVTDIKL